LPIRTATNSRCGQTSIHSANEIGKRHIRLESDDKRDLHVLEYVKTAEEVDYAPLIKRAERLTRLTCGSRESDRVRA